MVSALDAIEATSRTTSATHDASRITQYSCPPEHDTEHACAGYRLRRQAWRADHPAVRARRQAHTICDRGADQEARRGRPGMMRQVCTGCGNAMTIEELRAAFPRALSCCPERNMVDPMNDLIARMDDKPRLTPETQAAMRPNIE